MKVGTKKGPGKKFRSLSISESLLLNAHSVYTKKAQMVLYHLSFFNVIAIAVAILAADGYGMCQKIRGKTPFPTIKIYFSSYKASTRACTFLSSKNSSYVVSKRSTTPFALTSIIRLAVVLINSWS